MTSAKPFESNFNDETTARTNRTEKSEGNKNIEKDNATEEEAQSDRAALRTRDEQWPAAELDHARVRRREQRKARDRGV